MSMTQELFDFIAKELLSICDDNWYTDRDLTMLAEKYNLTYEAIYE